MVLISLGGAFEFYDLFMTAYVAPGLVASGLFTARPAAFFATDGIGFFVFCTFAGMWLGSMGFGFVADRLGRRAIFTFSLVWYSLATAVMAFQHSAAAIDLWRFIAAIGVGLEQVTIDTLLPELVPPPSARPRLRHQPVHRVRGGAGGGAAGLAAGAAASFRPGGLALGGADRRVGRAVAPGGFASACRKARAGWRCMAATTKPKRFCASWKRGPSAILGRALPPPGAASETSARQGRFRELFRPPYAQAHPGDVGVQLPCRPSPFTASAPGCRRLLIAKGIHVTTSLQYAFIIALANPVGPLLGLLVADRIERKWQIVAAGIVTGIGIFLFARQDDAALVILFGVLVTLANNWMSFTFHGYQAEQFPTRIRARAVGFVYSWSRVSAALAGLLIGFFLRQGGTMAVALFIGAAMVVMVLVIGAVRAATP